jgi:DedD protein
MAGGSKRGGERVLESRHLVGLFLGVVLLCGVFFTLGYVMGRTQYGGAVHAESPVRGAERATAASAPATDAATSASPNQTEWDFYSKKKGDQHADVPSSVVKDRVVENPAPPVEAKAPPRPPPALVPVKAPVQAPAPPPAEKLSAKNSIILQVAALSHQSDALAMAQVLQQKHFPAFVAKPLPGDNLYRVQVGPYSSDAIADASKAALDHDGFKAIIKH